MKNSPILLLVIVFAGLQFSAQSQQNQGYQSKGTQGIVKKAMLQESNANYSLSYKSGWGFRENGKAIGWIVGWIEENRHPYFFVLNLEGPADTKMTTIRLDILKGILKREAFFDGKR